MRRVPGVPGRAFRGVGSVAVYAVGPLSIVAIVWFQRLGLIASTPLWLLALIIVGTSAANFAASIWHAHKEESGLRLHVRVAISVLSTAAVIYAAGWGAVLLVAFALTSAELMRSTGPRTTAPVIGWTCAAIVAGETAVVAGLAPSVVGATLSHAIACVGGLCVLVVTHVLGRAATAAETAEQEIGERGRHFESLIERATDIIGVISADGSVVSVSPAVRTMLGYSPDEVRGRPISMFLHPAQVAGLDDLLQKALARRGEATTIEIRLMHRVGTDRVVLATLTSPSEGWGDQIIVNLHDLTTQRDLEERLRHDARHDPLTGLLNRAAFAEESERVRARAASRHLTVGMLFIDLDGFKQVNDSFGHEIGDRVLVETAARLEAGLRQDETLARLGGDEFAVLIDSVDGRASAIDVAERILQIVSEPFPGLPDDVRVGASIGIALRSDAGIEMSTLMKLADEAMYSAKRNGRSRWELSAAATAER